MKIWQIKARELMTKYYPRGYILGKRIANDYSNQTNFYELTRAYGGIVLMFILMLLGLR